MCVKMDKALKTVKNENDFKGTFYSNEKKF